MRNNIENGSSLKINAFFKTTQDAFIGMTISMLIIGFFALMIEYLIGDFYSLYKLSKKELSLPSILVVFLIVILRRFLSSLRLNFPNIYDIFFCTSFFLWSGFFIFWLIIRFY